MDIELILYIIFIAIVLLMRAFKSKKDDNAPHPHDADTMDSPHDRPQRRMTFDELLREFTGEAEQQQPRQREKAGHAREEEISDHEVQKTYKRSVSEAKKLKTLDEQVSLDAPLPRFKSFTQPEEENEIAVDIHDMLKDAEGAKKSIILSEIINRKY